MLCTKPQLAKSVFMLGALVAGADLVPANPACAGQQQGPKQIAKKGVEPKPSEHKRTDCNGDPLPPGALARLGSVRFRHSKLWVTGAAFTPDGKHLVSAGWDTMRLWERATGKLLRTFRGNTSAVLGLALSLDGKTVASAGNDGAIRIYETATGRELCTIDKAHEGSYIASVALSPDGKILASGGGGNGARTLVLWDIKTGKELHVLRKKQATILSVAFSPDGKSLACGGLDQTVELWDVATGNQVRWLRGHGKGVAGVAFSPDGAKVISGSHDDTVRVWNTSTGRELLRLKAEGGVSRDPLGKNGNQSGGVHSIALSGDGKRLAAGGYNGSVRIWHAETGKELVKLHANTREVEALAFAPDGKALATAGYDHVIHLWDTSDGKRLTPAHGHDNGLQFVTIAPSGRRVASVGNDRTVRLWDPATGQQLHVLRGHAAWIACAAFSPDARQLASRDEQGFIRLWDTATGKELRNMRGQDGYIVSLAYSPDGKLLASGSWAHGDDHSVRLWDPADGKELRTLTQNPRRPYWSVRFLRDSKTMAAESINALALLDVATGKELRRFEGSRVRLGPNGRVLSFIASDDRIRLWDLETGRELGRFLRPKEGVRYFACSPDDRMATWAPDIGPDATVRLWEVATGKVRGEFEGHNGTVTSVAFAPDGNTVITGSEDTTLLVWDVTRRSQVSPGKVSDEELAALWHDLAADDAAKAYDAVCRLARTGPQSVPFLKERLRQVASVEDKHIAQLIADLDSGRFDRRQRATTELEKLRELAGAELRKALHGKPSLETRRRLETLVDKLNPPITSPDLLQALRAVEVLEHCGSPEARQILETLARGAPAARLTQDAKASLARMVKRPAPGD